MAVRFEAAATAANVGRLQRASSITSAPYTVLVWMLSDAAADTGTEVFDLYSNDWSSDAWIELDSNDRAIILGTDTYTFSANKYNYSTWHCYAMVRSGTTQTGYRIDGGVVLTRTTSTPSDFDLETLLGYEDDPDSSACAVAHYKSWHAALTLEELAKEMQQFAPVRTANLASWSKFDVHTDLSDEIAESWTAINQTPTTVAGPTGIPEEWEGPRVASSATTAGTTSAGGLSCNMPSGTVAGDLLMAFAANDTSVSWSASIGWEKIDDGANGTAVQGACWARIATGSDALTITGEAQDIAVVVSRIVNHGVSNVATDIIVGTAATGSSNAPNPPNCNPGTSGKYLWITHYAADDDDDVAVWWPVEGAPVAQIKSATGTSSCMTGVAYRWLEASSYDPSAFALSASEEWRAQTFAIPPSSGAVPVTIDCDSGDAVASGVSASVASPITIACGVGQAIASGHVAAIAQSVTIACATGQATAAGLAAAVASPVTIECATGKAVAAGLAAGIASPVTIACNLGEATAYGLPASVSSAQTVQASAGAAVASGLPAGIASSVTIACAVGQAEAAGLQASVSAGVVIACQTGAAQAAGLPAGVSSPVAIACGTGGAVAAGLQAMVSSDAAVMAHVGAAIASGLPATVSSPQTIAAEVGQAAAAGLPVSISSEAIVLAGVGRAVASGLPAQVSGSATIEASTGQAHASGLPAQIVNPYVIPCGIGAAVALGLTANVSATTTIVCGVGAALAAGLVADIDAAFPAAPESRTYTVPTESRVFQVAGESRVLRA